MHEYKFVFIYCIRVSHTCVFAITLTTITSLKYLPTKVSTIQKSYKPT